MGEYLFLGVCGLGVLCIPTWFVLTYLDFCKAAAAERQELELIAKYNTRLSEAGIKDVELEAIDDD